MTPEPKRESEAVRFGIRDATHLYSGVPALQGVSFELCSGAVHGLVGENGSGKSTLIKILTGALRPTAGNMYMDDEGVSFSLPAAAQRAGIGVVHQDYNLFPDLNVAANVFGISQAPPRRRWLRTVDRGEVENRVHELLVGLGLDLSPNAMVRDLGPAERKFVEIARAMLLQPRFLILDEPTASLEPQASKSVLDLLDTLRNQNVGLCFISHRLDEVVRIADLITVLRDGAQVDTIAADGATEESLAGLIVGGKKVAGSGGERRVGEETMLSVKGLRLRPDVAPIEFNVRRGEIFGLAGLLGSGAAEIVRSLGGAEPLRGSVEVDGVEVRIKNPRDAKRAGIGFIPEDRKTTGLVPDQSVAVNVSLSSLEKVVVALGWLNRQRLTERALDYKQGLDIRMLSVDAPVRTLSGGNQQKVMLAKCLASGVRVLAIEEPTHGIDIGAKTQVHRLLRDLANDGGAIIIASTDVHEVLALCDRIGVMRHGALAAVLDRGELTTHELTAMGARDPEVFLESMIETGEGVSAKSDPQASGEQHGVESVET